MAQVITPEHMQAARALKASWRATPRARPDPLGAYVPGADPITDRAVQLHGIEAFLCQGTKEEAPMGPCIAQLEHIMA
jgi:flagellum-specific ATP synthase